jgi:hypothetical protein
MGCLAGMPFQKRSGGVASSGLSRFFELARIPNFPWIKLFKPPRFCQLNRTFLE